MMQAIKRFITILIHSFYPRSGFRKSSDRRINSFSHHAQHSQRLRGFLRVEFTFARQSGQRRRDD